MKKRKGKKRIIMKKEQTIGAWPDILFLYINKKISFLDWWQTPYFLTSHESMVEAPIGMSRMLLLLPTATCLLWHNDLSAFHSCLTLVTLDVESFLSVISQHLLCTESDSSTYKWTVRSIYIWILASYQHILSLHLRLLW
jgi:hypothetical protein